LNYGELKTQITDTLKRNDLDDDVVNLIKLAESDIEADLHGSLREQTATLTVVDGKADLPDGFRKLLNVQLAGVVLQPADREAFDGLRPVSGIARYYRVLSGKIELYPAEASGDLTIIYEAGLTRLINDDDTNEILTRFPSVYLYGALLHCAPFIHYEENITVYGGFYERGMDKANKTLQAELLPASLQMRPSGAVV